MRTKSSRLYTRPHLLHQGWSASPLSYCLERFEAMFVSERPLCQTYTACEWKKIKKIVFVSRMSPIVEECLGGFCGGREGHRLRCFFLSPLSSYLRVECITLGRVVSSSKVAYCLASPPLPLFSPLFLTTLAAFRPKGTEYSITKIKSNSNSDHMNQNFPPVRESAALNHSRRPGHILLKTKKERRKKDHAKN